MEKEENRSDATLDLIDPISPLIEDNNENHSTGFVKPAFQDMPKELSCETPLPLPTRKQKEISREIPEKSTNSNLDMEKEKERNIVKHLTKKSTSIEKNNPRILSAYASILPSLPVLFDKYREETILEASKCFWYG